MFMLMGDKTKLLGTVLPDQCSKFRYLYMLYYYLL